MLPTLNQAQFFIIALGACQHNELIILNEIQCLVGLCFVAHSADHTYKKLLPQKYNS